MNDLIKFRMPAEFVKGRVPSLRADELVYGVDHGWIQARDAVDLAFSTVGSDAHQTETLERLSFLLSDELDRVGDLVGELRHDDREGDPEGDRETDSAEVWQYLTLSWVHEHKGDFSDPYEAVEMLYADFDYPDALAPLARFTPVAPGEPSGLSAIDRKWEAYLRDRETFYRTR